VTVPARARRIGLKVQPIVPSNIVMKCCGVCGGRVREGAIYRARDGADRRLYQLPAIECVDCGSLCPDVDRIRDMCDADVPSSVRIRCAELREAG
jgi:hypothetical protein